MSSSYFSADVQKTYNAVCIYKPNGSDELAVQPGDTLVHVNRDPNGWVKVKNKATDLVGWVPMATLEEASGGDPNTPTTPVLKDGSDNHITGIGGFCSLLSLSSIFICFNNFDILCGY